MRKTLLLAILLFAPTAIVAVSSARAAETVAMKTVTLAVENMTCGVCPITVRKALEEVPGVAQAKVDFDKKTVTVTFDPVKTKVEDLTSATTGAGYPSTLAPWPHRSP